MGWTARKAITRTGLSALGVLLAKTAVDLYECDTATPIVEAIMTNVALIGIIWIGAALFMWIVTKFVRFARPSR